jgi:hypothetical protein
MRRPLVRRLRWAGRGQPRPPLCLSQRQPLKLPRLLAAFVVYRFEMFTKTLVQFLGRDDLLKFRRQIQFVDGVIRRAVNLKGRMSFRNILRFPICAEDEAVFVGNDRHLHDHISQSLWNSGK